MPEILLPRMGCIVRKKKSQPGLVESLWYKDEPGK
jgi:hypothetical protein